jgi:hypothetical protein
LYALFDVDLERFGGLLVRTARQSLSQVLPDLVAEARRLRREGGVPEPDHVRLGMDRGGYQGSRFQTLMEDPQVSFVAMARATRKNVRQWDSIPESEFQPYHPPGETNPNLQIATSQTQITGCRHPLPSVVIRDDTPGTRQRWRVLFHKEEPGPAPSGEALDSEYRPRQHHEMGFRQYVHDLAGHSLPKAYRLIREPNAQGQKRRTVRTEVTDRNHQEVHLVAWLKFLTFNWVKDLGARLGPPYAVMHVSTLVRKFLQRPGRLYLEGEALVAQLDPFGDAEVLAPYLEQLNQRRLSIPWLNNLTLQVEIAPQPLGLAATPQILERRILANLIPVADLPHL